MKRTLVAQFSLLFSITASVAILGIVAGEACTPQQRAVARTVIDVATAACLFANADRPDDEVKSVCDVVDTFDEPMRDFLKKARAERAELRRASAARCEGGGK